MGDLGPVQCQVGYIISEIASMVSTKIWIPLCFARIGN